MLAHYMNFPGHCHHRPVQKYGLKMCPSSMSTSEVLGILTGLRQGWPPGLCISPCQPVAQLQSGSPQERIGTSTTAATTPSPLRNNDSMGHVFSKFILNDLHPLRGCYSYYLKFQKL